MSTVNIKPTDTGTSSLAHWLVNAKAGDIINLAPGLYRQCPDKPTLYTVPVSGVKFICATGLATIDGSLVINGNDNVFQGIEVALLAHTNRTTANAANPPWPDFELPACNPEGTRDFCRSGFNINGARNSFVDCVARDNIGGGFGTGSASSDTKFYNCVAYRNGWRVVQNGVTKAGHGHGWYVQGRGTVVENCLSFGNYNFAAQTSGNYAPVSDNVTWLNNVFAITSGLGVGTGGLFTHGTWQGGTLGAVIKGNLLYDFADKNNNVDANIGYDGGLIGAVVTDNVLVKPQWRVSDSVTNPNTVYVKGGYPTSGQNIYAMPHRSRGGGRVVVYNWGEAPSVIVPALGLASGSQAIVTNELNPGDTFTALVTPDGIALPMNRAVATSLRNCYPLFGVFDIRQGALAPEPPPVTPPPVTPPHVCPPAVKIIPTVAELDTISGVGLTLAKRIRAFLEAYKS